MFGFMVTADGGLTTAIKSIILIGLALLSTEFPFRVSM